MTYTEYNIDSTFMNVQLVSEILMFVKTNLYKGETLVFKSVQESVDPNKIHLYKELFEKLKHLDIIWFAHPDYKNEDWVKQYDFVTYVDYLQYQTYTHNINHNTSWNFDSNRILCHTGRPYKFNRTKLIMMLSERGLLKHCEYSYRVPNKQMQDACRKFFVDWSDEDFYTWMSEHHRAPTGVDLYSINDNIVDDMMQGLNLSNTLSQSSLFNITVESWFCEVLPSQEPFLTEKTWKPILHNLPFIHVGQPGSLNKLKNLGFKTFEEYLLVPYDHITDQEQRMSAVIENIAYWFDHIHDHKDNIIKDIQHNYQHFLKTIHDLESDLDSKGIKELLPTNIEYLLSKYPQYRLTFT